MEFRQIRYFLEIHHAGSFVAAARNLGLTQPALSHQIHLLEREMGVKLFNRNGKISLTESGEIFRVQAVKLSDLWKETADLLNRKTELSGEYTICAGATIAAFVLPPVLKILRQQYKNVTFRIIEGDSMQTTQALISGQADIGIITGRIPADSFLQRVFFQDRLLPVVAADHHLVRSKKNIKVEQLENEDFVLFHKDSAIRKVFDEKQRALKFNPKIVMELRSMESVLQSVRSGIGIGFVSELAITDLKPLHIAELTAERIFYFCRRVSSSGLLDELINKIEDETFRILPVKKVQIE